MKNADSNSKIFHVGDKIVAIFDWTDSTHTKEGVITKISGDICFIDGCFKSEDCLYLAYCWPIAYKQRILDIIQQRQVLKKAYDDSMGLVYKLRNEITLAAR